MSSKRSLARELFVCFLFVCPVSVHTRLERASRISCASGLGLPLDADLVQPWVLGCGVFAALGVQLSRPFRRHSKYCRVGPFDRLRKRHVWKGGDPEGVSRTAHWYQTHVEST